MEAAFEGGIFFALVMCEREDKFVVSMVQRLAVIHLKLKEIIIKYEYCDRNHNVHIQLSLEPLGH